MTLEEKIDYLGGINDYYLRAIPRLGLPELRTSDGPVGSVIMENQPLIRLASRWRPLGILNLPTAWVPAWVRMRALGESISSSDRG